MSELKCLLKTFFSTVTNYRIVLAHFSRIRPDRHIVAVNDKNDCLLSVGTVRATNVRYDRRAEN